MGVIYVKGSFNFKYNRIDDTLSYHLSNIPFLLANYVEGLALIIEGDSLSFFFFLGGNVIYIYFF
jgi:hypothetical protein